MNCPVCDGELVQFADLPTDIRKRLTDDPSRQRQGKTHRLEKHTACPECALEIHGCGQPYAIPEEASPTG